MTTDDLTERFTDVERAMASCVLAHGTLEVVTAIRPEQVADPTARKIIETAAQLLGEGQKPDPVTVGNRLATVGRDWPLRVFEVFEHPGAVWANWRTYAALLVDGDYRRRAVGAARRIIQAAESSNLDGLDATLTAAGEVSR